MAGRAEDSQRNAPVLVTGSTGLLGNNVIRLLLAQGRRVRVLVRAGSDPLPLQGLDLDVVVGDILDESSLNRAISGVSFVVHSAGCVFLGWRNAKLLDQVNHLGARNVARAARSAGVRMLHVSSVNSLGVGTREKLADEQWVAAPNVPCQYVLSKQAGDRSVQEQVKQGLDAVTVYPALMFGPWDWKPSSGRMLLKVARRFTPFAPRGGCSVCDVRDVAQAIVNALETAPTGRHYVLGGANVTYLKIWQTMAEIAGGSRPICRFGPLFGIVVGRSGDVWGRLTGREPDVNSATLKLASRFHYFSSARAERELGYSSRHFQESIKDAWQWFQEHRYV